MPSISFCILLSNLAFCFGGHMISKTTEVKSNTRCRGAWKQSWAMNCKTHLRWTPLVSSCILAKGNLAQAKHPFWKCLLYHSASSYLTLLSASVAIGSCLSDTSAQLGGKTRSMNLGSTNPIFSGGVIKGSIRKHWAKHSNEHCYYHEYTTILVENLTLSCNMLLPDVSWSLDAKTCEQRAALFPVQRWKVPNLFMSSCLITDSSSKLPSGLHDSICDDQWSANFHHGDQVLWEVSVAGGFPKKMCVATYQGWERCLLWEMFSNRTSVGILTSFSEQNSDTELQLLHEPSHHAHRISSCFLNTLGVKYRFSLSAPVKDTPSWLHLLGSALTMHPKWIKNCSKMKDQNFILVASKSCAFKTPSSTVLRYCFYMFLWCFQLTFGKTKCLRSFFPSKRTILTFQRLLLTVPATSSGPPAAHLHLRPGRTGLFVFWRNPPAWCVLWINCLFCCFALPVCCFCLCRNSLDFEHQTWGSPAPVEVLRHRVGQTVALPPDGSHGTAFFHSIVF